MVERKEILAYLSSLKSYLGENGIEKIGLFGSFAGQKADEYSDIDIVIKTTPAFVKKYDGVTGFLFLEDLRRGIQNRFHRQVDICDEAGLKNTAIIGGAIYA